MLPRTKILDSYLWSGPLLWGRVQGSSNIHDRNFLVLLNTLLIVTDFSVFARDCTWKVTDIRYKMLTKQLIKNYLND